MLFQALRNCCSVNLHKNIHCLHSNMGKMNKIVAISSKCTSEDWCQLIQQACETLSSGSVISVPTDTIYGIAALAQSTKAVSKLYDIKARDLQKPISICVGDVQDVYKWGNVIISNTLLKALLPGPVTVVFERTASLNPELNPGTPLVGIRVPDYGFVRDIARHSGEPLALTSANITAGPSTVCVDEFQELWPKLDLVFDGGIIDSSASARLGSTVVNLSEPGYFSIIREGSAYRNTVEILMEHGLQEKKSKLS